MTHDVQAQDASCAAARGCEPAAGFASTAVNRRSFLAGGAAVGLGMSGLATAGARHGDGAARRQSRTGSTSITTSSRRRSAR